MRLTKLEKAYLAGLFDGEGTVGYYHKTKLGYHIVQVAIYNSDPTIMAWIQDRISFGSIVSNKVSKHRGWAWMVSSKTQAKQFLKVIRPYLVIKAEQVDLLLSFLDAEQKNRGVGSGKKLSKDELATRVETEIQLKRLKTANFQSIH